MKKLIIILLSIHASLFTIHTFSQGCLPEGIEFTNQAQIDSFQVNYPGCTEIEGDVTICGNDITNLNGLFILTSIGGELLIGLHINNNHNPLLSNLSGLDNLTNIGGDLDIAENLSMASLEGLENLTSIGGYLDVSLNTALISISGLENVTSIGGDLIINNNDALISLVGLDNIDPESITNISIKANDLLSTCDVQSICDYLVSPNGVVNIYYNASGCNSTVEIANACNIVLPCLPYGNYYIQNQTEIDSFQINYPNCTEIEGDLKINGYYSGNDITNLNGLDGIVSVVGDLYIESCELLFSLSGLDNLTSIGGLFHIHNNDNLVNLSGLGNLSTIGESLNIQSCGALINFEGLESLTSVMGSISIGSKWGQLGNWSLINLSGLNNLTSIGENLSIMNNSITSLHGLENLTTVGGSLSIGNNGNYSGPNPYLASISALSNLTTIGESLTIVNANNLPDLTGLENLSFVGSDFYIAGNNALSSLTDFNSLSSIGGSLFIFNNALTDLSGLYNINFIGGDLNIAGNEILSSLTGFENLTTLNGYLLVYDNDNLTSLSGLENVDANSITDLYIYYNSSLSNCVIQSICDYLFSPNGNKSIHDNAPGCNSPEEVDSLCNIVSVQESTVGDNFFISPNPCSGTSSLRFTINDQGLTICDLFEISGVRVKRLLNDMKIPGLYELEIDLRDLPKGIYFLTLKTNDGMLTKKIIKL